MSNKKKGNNFFFLLIFFSSHKDPDVDMLGGIQLLRLELELQNTWQHMDWGPAAGLVEKMDCDSHYPDDWGGEITSVCDCQKGKDD